MLTYLGIALVSVGFLALLRWRSRGAYTIAAAAAAAGVVCLVVQRESQPPSASTGTSFAPVCRAIADVLSERTFHTLEVLMGGRVPEPVLRVQYDHVVRLAESAAPFCTSTPEACSNLLRETHPITERTFWWRGVYVANALKYREPCAEKLPPPPPRT